MPLLTDSKTKLSQLVTLSGGTVVDELFVTKPGCAILNKTESTEQGKALYEAFHIDSNRPCYEQRAEFRSRITYLSFRDEPCDSACYNEKMAKEYQHLSVHSSTYIEFLIAGISIETALELVSHGEASVGRLTSSNTKAMDHTLYRLQGDEKSQTWQKRFIEKFMNLREQFKQDAEPENRELWNIENLGSKCTALTYCMSLKDFHKLFIGRLSEKGNEMEVQEICRIMCKMLQQLYPLVIRTPEEYYAMNNGEKYK